MVDQKPFASKQAITLSPGAPQPSYPPASEESAAGFYKLYSHTFISSSGIDRLWRPLWRGRWATSARTVRDSGGVGLVKVGHEVS